MLNPTLTPQPWVVTRDNHPLKPFLVCHNEEPVARFGSEYEARAYIWDRARLASHQARIANHHPPKRR